MKTKIAILLSVALVLFAAGTAGAAQKPAGRHDHPEICGPAAGGGGYIGGERYTKFPGGNSSHPQLQNPRQGIQGADPARRAVSSELGSGAT